MNTVRYFMLVTSGLFCTACMSFIWFLKVQFFRRVISEHASTNGHDLLQQPLSSKRIAFVHATIKYGLLIPRTQETGEGQRHDLRKGSIAEDTPNMVV